jgi:hypothetical protein
MLNQFSNLSCYEEFEIRCALIGISKVDVLKEIGHPIDDYYFFVSMDGIFNWFDLDGNHIEDPGVLKELKEEHIPRNIIKCIIPNSVTHIGGGVFVGCRSLTSINIPNSVSSIGNTVFYGCNSLTSITIPDNVKHIGNGSFFDCKLLTSITIPNNITSIGKWAFAYCESINSITIPNSITSIGEDAFCDCNLLKQVIFKGKTLEEVKQMDNYPFGIEDENIIKCEI